MNTFYKHLLIAGCLGAVGGLAKPALAHSQYLVPSYANGVFHPGFLGGILVGFVAAGLYWLINGPEVDPEPAPQLLSKQLAAAFMVGLSGSGWLGSEAERGMYKRTAILAAHNDPELSPVITAGTPTQAFEKAEATATAAAAAQPRAVAPESPAVTGQP